MRKTIPAILAAALSVISSVTLFAADPPWQKITNPTAKEIAAKFENPPAEYANTVTWGWGGPVSPEVITRDIESLYNRGFRIVTIEAGSNMVEPYLSEGWFKLIRHAAEQARQRGMKIVIIDEGKYPSGFVNGKYTQERPDLRLQALVNAGQDAVEGGAAYDKTLDASVVSAIAFNSADGSAVPLEIVKNEIHWKAPAGKWTVVTVKHDFRTPQTRAVNDPTGAKTTNSSVGDLINPEASKLFIEWTHEQYKKHVGEFFGNTIIGFRGDEAELTGVPWTAAIFDEFQKRKGYDVRKYMASFLLGVGGGRGGAAAPAAIRVTDEQRRAKADYFDVWSDLFATYFFGAQGEWCEANGLQALTHLNNDHNMPGLVATTGDFYRAMRKLQVPGVDVIWSQVYPGTIADFVKFPSSASHLFGRPRSMSESFAAYNADQPATYDVVNFAVNYQMVRGINMFEFMFAPASSGARGGAAGGRGYMADEKFPQFMAYTNRMTYLLSQGKPMAQVAVYMPTMSMWLNDRAGNQSMMAIAQMLNEAQHDFDFADEQALSKEMTLKGGEFVNLSGSSYRAVIVPSSVAMSKLTLDRLQAFAKAGGKVIFAGSTPTMVVDKTFVDAKPPADLSWATVETGGLTAQSIAALPKSDVVFDQPAAAVKVMHRKLQDSDLYFFFNESDHKQTVSANVAGTGSAQVWDAWSAKIAPLAGAAPGAGGTIKLPVELEKHQGKLIVVGGGALAAGL